MCIMVVVYALPNKLVFCIHAVILNIDFLTERMT